MLQDRDDYGVKSKVIPTNSVNKVNKLTENFIGNIFSNSSLYDATGKLKEKSAKELSSKLNKLKDKIKQHYKDNNSDKLPQELLESLHRGLTTIGITVPMEVLSHANDKNSVQFRDVLTNKTTSFYSFRR